MPIERIVTVTSLKKSDGTQAYSGVGVTTLRTQTFGTRRATLWVEVAALTGTTPTVAIALRQGVDRDGADYITDSYTPDDGVFTTFSANGIQRRDITGKGEILEVDVTLGGANPTATVRIRLVERPGD